MSEEQNRVTVYWTFRNDHTWSKGFDDDDLMTLFVNSCGLVTHPDIYKITVSRGVGKEEVLKDVRRYNVGW